MKDVVSRCIGVTGLLIKPDSGTVFLFVSA